MPYWAGGALVAVVVMSYVFLGGMRGTAFVNAFQTVLFLSFGLAAVLFIGYRSGGFGAAMQRIAASPDAWLLTRERVSPWYFFAYTLIPLSTITFPHISIFCLTARRMREFKRTIVLYPICILAIWLRQWRFAPVPGREVRPSGMVTLRQEGGLPLILSRR